MYTFYHPTKLQKLKDYVGREENGYKYRSDIFVEDASFVRMDNLTLGYNFKDIFSKGSSLRIYGMAQNVFVITDYSGVDPEIFGNIDNGFYQRPKIYSLGLNFNF